MFRIGDIIKTYRMEQRISQEELAYGICATSNLSKIERGVLTPSRSTYEALMQRMGKSGDIYPSLMSAKELELYQLRHDIRKCLFYKEYSEAERLLQLLEKGHSLDNVYTQFVCYTKAILQKRAGKPLEEVLALLEMSLNLTIPDFKSKKILYLFLTKDEIEIFNNISIALYQLGDKDTAIKILYELKEYFEKRIIESDEKAAIYTMIIYNLSKWIGEGKGYEDAVKLCDLGIEYCIKYNKLAVFPLLLYNKGYGLIELGREDEAADYIKQAYYVFRAVKDTSTSEHVKKFAEKNRIDI